MKLRAQLVLFVSALVACISFGQAAGGGSGGVISGPGSLPSNPANWQITVTPLSGSCQFNRMEWVVGSYVSAHYHRDWVTGQWRRNGILMTTLLPAPYASEPWTVLIRPPITMTSEGVSRVRATWIGEGPAPKTANVVVTSSPSAEAHNGSLAVDANNGLGDPAVITQSVGYSRAISSGRHARVIVIQAGAGGTGHLDVPTSASASGEYVVASAEAVSAVLDARTVSIESANGVTEFWEEGPSTDTTISWAITIGSYTTSQTFPSRSIDLRPVQLQYGPGFTDYAHWKIGLNKTLEGLPAQSPLDLAGAAFWANYPGQGPLGNYRWSTSTGHQPWSGSLAHSPVDRLNRIFWTPNPVDVYGPSPNGWTWLEERPGITGMTFTNRFEVEFQDGVKGQSVRDIQFLRTSEPEMVSPKIRLTNEEHPGLPWHQLVGLASGIGFVDSGHDVASFFDGQAIHFIWSALGAAKTAAEVGEIIASVSKFDPAMAALSSGIGFTIAEVEREAFIVSRLINGTNSEVVVIGEEGSEAEFRSQPQLYEWKVAVQPEYEVRNISSRDYGPRGFEGSGNFLEQAGQKLRNAKRRFIVRRVGIAP